MGQDSVLLELVMENSRLSVDETANHPGIMRDAVFKGIGERQMPESKEMSYTEKDWVDEEASAHRGPED